MNSNRLFTIVVVLTLMISGCSGGSDPVNEGKDRPAPPPKKDKDK